MKPLISVIVPVYKVEDYLCKCIDSILNQTYTNMEVILVDDGSPDNCGVICDAYAEKDSRIKVIHKANGGLSDARNVGMAASKGDFLSFVDSDDWLEKDAIATLYDLLCDSQALISMGGMQRVESRTGKILASDFDGTECIRKLTKIEAMRDVFVNGCAAWGKLYRRSVFDGIVFPVGEINEDEAIILSLLDRCEVMVTTNRVIYNYRYRTESITTAPFTVKDLAWKNHCAANLEFVRKHYPELEEYAAERYRSSLLWHITKISLLDDCSMYRSEIKQIMTELRNEKNKFDRIPMDTKKSALQYLIAMYGGFWVYRTIFRIKQGKPL